MSPSRVSPPPPSDLSSGLTKEQLEFWDTNGYLLIPDALSQDVVKELYDESNSLLNDFSLDDHPMTKFSTGEKSDHVGDSYFLESGDKVRFFFEEGKLALHVQRPWNYLLITHLNRRLRRERHPKQTQTPRHQQDRPLPPPSQPILR